MPLAAMTASIPLLEEVKQRLQELLEKARQLKSSPSIEPPLPVANFTGELGLPPRNVSSKLHQSTVEIAAKQALQAQLVCMNQMV
jgi:hypothetical protein